jgi:PST family polysaccharide transporter
MPSYGRVARTGVMWGILGRFAYELVSVPTSMLLARWLSPIEFGVAAAVGIFVSLAQRFTDLGFTLALMRQKTISKEEASTVFYVNACLGLSAWVLLSISAQLFGSLFKSTDVARALPIAALTFLFSFLGSVPQMFIIRSLRFKASSNIDFLGTVVTSAVGLAMAWWGFGFWSLVLSQVAAAGLQTLLRFWIAGWWPSLTFSRQAFWSLWSTGLAFHFKRILDSLTLYADNAVIARTLGLTALGFYDKGFVTMTRAVNVLNSAAPTVSFQIFTFIVDDTARFRSAYRKVLVAAMTMAYPLFGWLVVMAPELFSLLFGPQWRAAVFPFRLLCVVGLIRLLSTFASSGNQAAGAVWKEVPRNAAYVAAIVVGTGLGSWWGLNGATVGVVAAAVVWAGLSHQLLCRTTGIEWGDLVKPQIPGLVAGIGLVATLLIVRGLITRGLGLVLPDYEWLALAAGIAFLFGLLYLRFNPFPELRGLVVETAKDLPAWASWLTRWFAPLTSPADSDQRDQSHAASMPK